MIAVRLRPTADQSRLLPRKPLLQILLFALAARVCVVLLHADFNNDYYWEYGTSFTTFLQEQVIRTSS